MKLQGVSVEGARAGQLGEDRRSRLQTTSIASRAEKMLERLGLSSITGPPAAQGEQEKAAPAEKPKCKACCACPETKRARDEW